MNEKKMTHEQARKILSEYLDLDKEEHSEFLEAIRTLIQPQEEIQCGHSIEEIEKSFIEDVEAVKEQLPNGDLISREELLKAIDTWDKFGCNADTKLVPYQDHYIPYIHYDDVVKCIKGMPSVAIQNKVGHWEYNQYDGNPNIGNWHCSECRNIVSDMPTCMGKPLYEFCPHCGCPMVIER